MHTIPLNRNFTQILYLTRVFITNELNYKYFCVSMKNINLRKYCNVLSKVFQQTFSCILLEDFKFL